MWHSFKNYRHASKWSSISFLDWQCPSDEDFSFPRFVGPLILSLWFPHSKLFLLVYPISQFYSVQFSRLHFNKKFSSLKIFWLFSSSSARKFRSLQSYRMAIEFGELFDCQQIHLTLKLISVNSKVVIIIFWSFRSGRSWMTYWIIGQGKGYYSVSYDDKNLIFEIYLYFLAGLILTYL
jgi:hypothetical protein